MAEWAERLGRLLPELYLREDSSGDLSTLLNILGPTLDDITAKITALPSLVSVENCPAEFLPLLAGLLAVTYDTTLDPEPQRLAIREAIARYQRVGTMDALRRELSASGWQGEIIETHRKVLRLGTRTRLNQQKLPGHRYNLGIYQVTGVAADDQELNQILDSHHPAGISVGRRSLYDY